MSKPTCSIEGCTKDSRARGMCWRHYQHERRVSMAPAPADPMAKLEARFWSKVDMSGDCWEWLGSHGKHGHGTFSMKVDGAPKTPGAHRVAYELANGPIPKGMHIDHICHNPACVNPEHLRPVTHKQNHENRKGASATSVTGVRGVHKSPVTGRYRAIVVHNRKAHSCGEFDTIAEANAAATAKRNELFTHNDADRTGSMTISDAAVEAAYRELPEGAGVYVNRADLRVILEAAAPHMLAEAKADAWDEGRVVGSDEERSGYATEDNPYRSQG